jgi:tRNA 2-thiouridine synthesizing protein E
MTTMEVAGKTLELDGEGFLTDHTEWNEDAAVALAAEEGIELTDRHWEVIRFVREYYAENDESPTLRRISKQAGVPTKELYQLFPQGPGKKVSRIAGTPKPEGCV